MPVESYRHNNIIGLNNAVVIVVSYIVYNTDSRRIKMRRYKNNLFAILYDTLYSIRQLYYSVLTLCYLLFLYATYP